MRRVALVVVMAALLPSLVHAFGQNKVQYRQFDWVILKSEHFDIYYYDREEFLARNLALIADAAYDSLARHMGHELRARIPIVIYRSHNEFQETNVTLDLLGEGTGGFTELFKNRVVLPFTGSYEELRHVTVHELTHVFTFDLLYGSLLESIFTRQYLFSLPLWFLEGLTEFESQVWDAEAEMVMRDAAITGYYFPLEVDVQGYLAYKQGQSVIKYIVDKYGREKLTDVIRQTAGMRNIDKALEGSIGVDSRGLTRAWTEHLKKQYWPDIAVRTDPDDLASRLTDHLKDDSFTNIMPAISPDGQKIVFLSDRSGYDEVFVMSALDGRIIKRLVKGQRSQDFESFHSLRSSFSWSPDGKSVALVSKRRDRDVINLIDVDRGKRLKRIELDFDHIFYPAYSPDGASLAFVGSDGGRAGLFVLSLEDNRIEALDIGALEYSSPCWSPDGKMLAFSCIAPGAVDSVDVFRSLGPLDKPDRDIYLINVGDGVLKRVTLCRSEDVSPVWSPDGTRMLFVSDRNGSYNLYVHDFADSSTAQLTDVLGGIFNPTWSARGDRLAFTCFNSAGWDIFQVKQPYEILEPKRTLPERQWPYEAPWLVLPEEVRPAGEGAGGATGDLAAEGDSAAGEVAEADTASLAPEPPAPGLTAFMDSLLAGSAVPESARIAADTTVHARPGEYQTVPYKIKFTPDWVAGAFQYSSAYGLGGMTRFSISDILGNHQIYVASDFFSSLEETDFLAIYYYLARRTDYGAGAFHFKNYYYSDRTTMGFPVGEGRQDKLFSERNYGGVVAVSLPLDMFRRFDLDFTAMRTEYEIYTEGSEDLAEPIVDTVYTKDVFVPRLSYVKDTALWGATGPVGGSRYTLSLERSIVDLLGSDLSFTTGMLDYRRYLRLSSSTQFAARMVAATSQGSQPTFFYLGGAYTLRGYDDGEFRGNNFVLGNFELRFPFIERLILRAPAISFGDLRGVLFFDMGGAWNGDFSDLRVAHMVDAREELKDLNASYGVGMRFWLAYFLVKLDCGWATQFGGTTGARVHFSLGGEF
ncbi:MAG: BamA/TamA family outer membrane protein [bacterium]